MLSKNFLDFIANAKLKSNIKILSIQMLLIDMTLRLNFVLKKFSEYAGLKEQNFNLDFYERKIMFIFFVALNKSFFVEHILILNNKIYSISVQFGLIISTLNPVKSQ